MLLSLGIGSQIGIMEGMIGTLFDIPQLKHIKKPILTGNFGYKRHAHPQPVEFFLQIFLPLNFCYSIFAQSFFVAHFFAACLL